jgi:hypothetical protein
MSQSPFDERARTHQPKEAIMYGSYQRWIRESVREQFETERRARRADQHREHAKQAGVATPCTASHVNFGGGCLNCGWMPRKDD